MRVSRGGGCVKLGVEGGGGQSTESRTLPRAFSSASSASRRDISAIREALEASGVWGGSAGEAAALPVVEEEGMVGVWMSIVRRPMYGIIVFYR